MKYNYKYGKLNAGILTYSPNKLVVGSEQVFNASANTYKSQDYLPIVKNEDVKEIFDYFEVEYIE